MGVAGAGVAEIAVAGVVVVDESVDAGLVKTALTGASGRMGGGIAAGG
jgi:hypothetical protein